MAREAAELEQERRGYLRLAVKGRMSEVELDGALAELEETRRTAESELEVVGSWRREMEQLERERDALRASWSAAVPNNLDSLTPEGRNVLYHKLRLEMRLKGNGFEVTGAFCVSEPLSS